MAEIDAQLVWEVGEDFVLPILAKAAQEHGMEVSVTLAVQGVVVTGLLTGRDRWVEEVGKVLASTGDFGRQAGESLEADWFWDLLRARNAGRMVGQPTIGELGV